MILSLVCLSIDMSFVFNPHQSLNKCDTLPNYSSSRSYLLFACQQRIEQRLDFLKLPITERRQILESQAEEMLDHYQQETDWKELLLA